MLHELSNILFFTEELNRFLAEVTKRYANAYYVALMHTDANLLCRDVFAKARFALVDGSGELWNKDLTTDMPAIPSHLSVTIKMAERQSR